MPAAALDPLAWFRLLRGGRHHRHDLVPVRHVHEIERHLRQAEVHEVAMAFDQSRNRELTGEIDHRGAGSDVALNLGVAADGRNAIAAHRDRLRLRHRIVDGHDLAVAQD
jgi:hypothetical protein